VSAFIVAELLITFKQTLPLSVLELSLFTLVIAFTSRINNSMFYEGHVLAQFVFSLIAVLSIS